MSPLPERVRVREVGPRDGFQNEPEVVPTADKVRLIELLAASGLERIEVTSFVRPDVIAQLADAEQVLEAVNLPDRVAVSVLIPNERGLERALRHRDHFQEINGFLSASETHNRKNVGRSIAESLEGLRRTFARARAEGLRCEGVISTSFGCPYEGHVRPEWVLEIARVLADAGAEEVGFGDTTGMANPVGVHEFFIAAVAALPDVELTAHFHNTRGQGLANALAALEAGRRQLRVVVRRARRVPGAPGSDRQHRHRGPRLDAPRDEGRDRDRPAGADRGVASRAGGARKAAGQPRAVGGPGGVVRSTAG